MKTTKKQPLFYHDIKPHLSPSAIAQWHYSRSQFIRSYFAGEKSSETLAMKTGKMLHALIEGSMLDVQRKYTFIEKGITISCALPKGGDATIYGIPDSYGKNEFVDYKTGQENTWTVEKLATDVKMLCTAWLVWQVNGCGDGVQAWIEWIPTEWNGEELVPKGTVEDHKIVGCFYTAATLKEFEKVIAHTVKEVNEEYVKWVAAEGMAFVSDDDCVEYATLEAQKKEIEAKQKLIKERIGEQMSFGGERTHESSVGTFYVTERKTYEYPKSLKARLADGSDVTLERAEEIEAAIGVVKKEYEMTAEPKVVSRSIGFRPKKK